MDIFKIFMLFVIYSFLGWLVETIYCSILEGKFIYRGFLNGPICPIYGFGALFVLFLLNNLKIHPILLFLTSILITSVLEYITSYLLESIFNMKWWDYSNKKFNINGRVCLLNSTLFGLLSLFLIEYIHPKVSDFLKLFSDSTVNIFSLLFLVYLIIDLSITVFSLLNLKPYLEIFHKYENKYKYRHNLKVSRNEVRSKYRLYKDNLVKDIERKATMYKNNKPSRLPDFKLGFSNKRIFNAYPGLSSRKHPKAIKEIRDYIKFFKKS